MFTLDRTLSLGTLLLLIFDNTMFRSSRSGGGRFRLAHQYATDHELTGLESFLSYGDFILLASFFAYMVFFTRKTLPGQAVYVLGGLGGAFVLLMYQLLKWYWAAKLCGDPSIYSPQSRWGALPVFLPLSLGLLGYFAWRVWQTRLFHFITHNRNG